MAFAVRVQPGEKVVPICVTNIWDRPIKIYRGQTAAELREISNTSESVVEPKTMYDPTTEVHIGNNLSAFQRQSLIDLVKANRAIFESENNHGFITAIEHQIATKIPGQITCALRRLPMGCVEDVDKTVAKHLQQEHIEPSQSPWAFPIVPVKKKDGTIRLCADYRPLNEITPSDSFPTNNMAVCLDQLLGAKYFSTIDLARDTFRFPCQRTAARKWPSHLPLVFGNGPECLSA